MITLFTYYNFKWTEDFEVNMQNNLDKHDDDYHKDGDEDDKMNADLAWCQSFKIMIEVDKVEFEFPK